MTEPLRLLSANLRVALNLKHADDVQRAQAEYDKAWSSLALRCIAIGCHLQACLLSDGCDGDCGCGPGLFDRNGHQILDMVPYEPTEKIAFLTRIVDGLETADRLRL